MKSNVNEVLHDAEEQLDDSTVLYIAVGFIVLTSFFLAYHSFQFFLRFAGGEAAGKGAYVNAITAVGCVELSLIALIVCHFYYFTTPAQKWIGFAGDVVTYVLLLFHAALNFRHNLFGYIDGFGQIYESNGLPVLIFGATLLTWGGIILFDVRAKMRVKTMSALSATRERDLRGVLKERATKSVGFVQASNDPKSESDRD